MKTYLVCNFLAMGLIFVQLVGLSAQAEQMDVAGSLEKLKANKENSALNFIQYKKNFEITSANIEQTNLAAKELAEQKALLKKSAAEMDSNQKRLTQMRDQVAGFKTAEQIELQEEEKKIEELQKVLAKLEANKRLRQQNLDAYDARLKEIEAEKQQWLDQNAKMGELLAEIAKKEDQVKKEREEWVEKRKHYRAETLKWKKANQLAEQTYTRFKKLEN